MTENEALKLIYDLVKENLDKLDAKTIFLLREAVGTLEHIIDKKIEELEKKAEYQRGYEQGRRSTITIKDFEKYYHIGFKHGQELRAKEAECAEACGMKRAWDVARKILSRHGEGYNATDMEVFGTDDVFSLSASEAVAKLEAWEKK